VATLRSYATGTANEVMNAIISLTTIPSRIEYIGLCLQSLVAQGLPVYLWAVEKIERSDMRLKHIPLFLVDTCIHVEIVEDRGPITKLLPALERGFDTIITADDDCTYDKDWARGLLTWAEKLPNAALGYRGRILTGRGYLQSRLVLKSRIKNPISVDIITGVEGALYHAKMFDKNIYDEWRCWPINDDLVISAHLKRRGITRYVIPSKCIIRNQKVRYITPLFEANTQAASRNDEGLIVLGLERRND